MVSLIDVLNVANNEETFAFPLTLVGNCTVANKKHLAKITIVLPREIVDDDLRTLDDWELMVVAIKQDEYDRVMDKLD